MRREPNGHYDGFSKIDLGVNSGLAPVAVPRNQLTWAVNATCRNGYVTNRPGFVRRGLRFMASDGTTDTSLRDHFQDGIFEGAAMFERRNQIVAMIGGRLFRIRPDRWDVLDVSTTDLNASNRWRAWFAEAEDFLVCQDGQSPPWLYDGATARRSDSMGIHGVREVPVGTAMVYGSARLDVTLADQRQFVVGDIAGGDSGTAAYGYRDAVVKFTENEVVNGGGAFSVPINAGKINALRPVAQLDTSTGQGPTQIFTSGGAFSLNTPTDRTTWANLAYPIGTVSMIDDGMTSDRATVNVNGDIWGRSGEGWRSFMVARRNFDTWVNAPMSQEMRRVIDRDNRKLLGYASAAVFDKRILFTVGPYRQWGHGIAHRGLAVMDFAHVAFLNNKATPVWEGLWTGLQILQVLSGTIDGVRRCFVFALNADSEIELWELTKDSTSDYSSESVPIEWAFETPAYTFGQNPDVPGRELLDLAGGKLFVDEIDGNVDFAAQYRADQAVAWQPWHTWSACAKTELCGTVGQDSCITPGNYRRQYRKPFNLPTPRPACDSVAGKPLNNGREFQVRLEVTGSCRIKLCELLVRDVQESDNQTCPGSESVCATVDVCEPDDFSYSIT